MISRNTVTNINWNYVFKSQTSWRHIYYFDAQTLGYARMNKNIYFFYVQRILHLVLKFSKVLILTDRDFKVVEHPRHKGAISRRL